MELLDPKEITLKKSGVFKISRLPCLVAREVFFRYLAGNVNLVAVATNYQASSGDIANKLISYTAHVVDGRDIRLESETLINQHVIDFAELGYLEGQMIQYNFDFLAVERWCPYLTQLGQHLEESVIKILMTFADSWLNKRLLRSTN